MATMATEATATTILAAIISHEVTLIRSSDVIETLSQQ